MVRVMVFILIAALWATADDEPVPATRPAREAMAVEAGATVVLTGRRDQRFSDALRIAYRRCLMLAATRLDPQLGRLGEKARGALAERIENRWHHIFIRAEVPKMSTDRGRLSISVRCHLDRRRLAETLAPQQAKRVVLITGPSKAARHLERQVAQRLTAAGYRTLPVIALAPKTVPLWRKAADRKTLGILFLHADKAKIHRVVHGRISTSTTGQLVIRNPLFTCTASVTWRLVDATTGKIEQARSLSAAAERLSRVGAETSAVDGLAAKLAGELIKILRKRAELKENLETIYVRVTGVRFSELRRVTDLLTRQASVKRQWLMYFTHQTGMFAVQLADGSKPVKLIEDFRRVGLKILERKGSEWSCEIVKPAASPPPRQP